MTLEIAILGSVEPRMDGDVLGVRAGKQRALLALLAVRAPHPVSAESAAEALWPNAAPGEAIRSVQVTVSRLRRSLGAAAPALETVASGYRLAVEADAIDARRFEQLSAEGHRALADGEPERAAGALREALSLWRGQALAEFAFETFAQAEIRRLEEERLAALEARVEADLAVGRHGELAGELAQLVAVHPLRERLHGQLMLSLYRCGRQADALQVYRDARDVLVGQLGIEPGPELRALERAILTHDAALELARPPVRGHGRARAGLIPAPPTPTIGREADLARLRGLLVEPAGQLVTVVGSGGVGKTRLALELARAIGEQFADGAYFVALAPVSGDEHVASTILRQLDAVLLPSESAEEGLARHLDEREVLLVLDNFEHVLGAAPIVADLLAVTTRLSVLVTSREPLRVRAERLFRLDPLAVPPADSSGDGADVEQAPAVALFLAVARSRDAGFALSEQNALAVADVCRRLDGLPLAIELAAGRIGLLTVPELAARLRDGLEALGTGTRDAPARQRTLAATLDWSYRLLTVDERAALAGLAVFAGGCTINAAQAVTGASLEVLEALVEKNLVVRRAVPNEPSRLTLLETVADFARRRLAERRDSDGVRRSHCDHYLAAAECAAPELERSDPPALMAELDREIHNLRAALAWALDRHAATTALRLASALGEYWDRRDLGREGARWLRAALALADDDVPASLRAVALGACAYCLIETETLADAEATARESLVLARSIGDLAQCAASTTALAIAALNAHRSEDGYRHATEAEQLAREARDEPKRVIALQIRALTAPTLGEALALGEQAAAALRSAASERRLALLQTSLTYNALVHGDDAAAQRLTRDALQSAETVGEPFVLSFAHGNEGLVALLTGDIERASEAFTRELELASRYQHELMLYEAINGLAGVAAARGEDERAAQLLGAAEGTRPERHNPAIARRLDDRCFDPARARLGEAQWRAANSAGAALTSRQAVDIALRAHEVLSPAGG